MTPRMRAPYCRAIILLAVSLAGCGAFTDAVAVRRTSEESLRWVESFWSGDHVICTVTHAGQEPLEVAPDSVVTNAVTAPAFLDDTGYRGRRSLAPAVDLIVPVASATKAPGALSAFLVRNNRQGRALLEATLALVSRYAADGRHADAAFRDLVSGQVAWPVPENVPVARPRLQVYAASPRSLTATRRLGAVGPAPDADAPTWEPCDFLAHVRGGSASERIDALERLRAGAESCPRPP